MEFTKSLLKCKFRAHVGRVDNVFGDRNHRQFRTRFIGDLFPPAARFMPPAAVLV